MITTVTHADRESFFRWVKDSLEPDALYWVFKCDASGESEYDVHVGTASQFIRRFEHPGWSDHGKPVDGTWKFAKLSESMTTVQVLPPPDITPAREPAYGAAGVFQEMADDVSAFRSGLVSALAVVGLALLFGVCTAFVFYFVTKGTP